MAGESYFAWPKNYVKNLLGKQAASLLFIPYAAVTISYDEYTRRVAEKFAEWGYSIRGIHQVQDKKQALEEAAAIVVGGGNSFHLLGEMQKEQLLDVVRASVQGGKPYIGWSAGSNLACPTIMTTNDMPIVEVANCKALHLVPFQINPHYTDRTLEGHGGESRAQRIDEFLVKNPHKAVVGLPEGSLLQASGENVQYVSNGNAGNAKIFRFSAPVCEIANGQWLHEIM
jgi:dipeptidase E